MGNAYVLGASIFFIVFTAYFTTQFDRNLCPNVSAWENTTMNETGLKTDWKDYIWNNRCSGLPAWYHLLIYTPFIAMAIRSIIATS